jgi:hypothetical protein
MKIILQLRNFPYKDECNAKKFNLGKKRLNLFLRR